MAFTRQQLSNVTSQASTPSFDPNAMTMQSLPPPATSQGNFGEQIAGVGKAILKPVINLGGEMAAGSATGKALEKSIGNSNQQATTGDYNYLKQVNQHLQEATKNGDSQNAKRYADVLKNFQFSNGTKMTDAFPNINDTPEQVIGNTIGTGLLALSGGTLSAGSAALEAPTLINAIRTGATTGLAYGGVGAGANAMSDNKSAGEVLKSTTQGAVIGGATGGAIGGVTYGVGKALYGSEPTITVNGKTLTSKQLQTSDGQDFINTLPAQDKAAVENFSKGIYPTNPELSAANEKAAVQMRNSTLLDSGNKVLSQDELNGLTMPESSSATVNPGRKGLIETMKGRLNAASSETATASTNRANDAIPSYNKKMVDEPMVKQADGTMVPRVQEGTGMKGRVVNATQSEIAAGEELKNIPNYPDKGTALDKMNAVDAHNASISKEFRTALQNEKVLRPPQEINKVVQNAVDSASENSVILQKTDPIVSNYMRVTQRLIDQTDGTLAGEDKIRIGLDNAYKDAGGKFAGNKALDQVHMAARTALNEDIAAHAQSTKVPEYLSRMSKLYNASDTLSVEAKGEYETKIGRYMQDHPMIKKLAMKPAMKLIREALGISIATAALTSLIKSAQGK